LCDSKPELVDISIEVQRHRIIKSDREIEIIKRACEIANIGCDHLTKYLKVGMKECDIAQKGVKKMNHLISESYPNIEIRDTWVWLQSGINTDGAHNAVTSKKVENGDIISINCFPMIDSYYVALERTAFVGTPSREHLH